ncbi:MAG: phosphoribosylanthranilate isomerase [Kofleriaceae bacterium]
MTPAKICGVTRPDDAAYAAHLGAAYLGFNFWARSKRFVEPVLGRALARTARAASPAVQCVGVFVDAPVEEIVAVARLVGLDAVQLHGDEPVADGAALTAAGLTVWKAIAIAGPDDLARVAAWPAAVHVLDAASPARGGSGQTIDWSLAAQAVAAGHPVILAGGLTPRNVASAIAQVRPLAVDVASGVETSPGVKDPIAVHQFLDATRRAVSYLRR